MGALGSMLGAMAVSNAKRKAEMAHELTKLREQLEHTAALADQTRGLTVETSKRV